MSQQTVDPALRSERRARAGLVVQPVLILLALGAIWWWISAADLSATEQVTLAPANLWALTWQHLELTAVAAVIVLLLAIPCGIVLTRRPFRRLTPPILAVANFGQAAPAVGLIVLCAMWLGFGFTATVVGLIVYAFLPVLRNTMVGLDGVDQRLVEAARGMGMSSLAVLVKVELPLAVPVMLAGIRTALVILVGTATLGAFIDGGGLGLLITTGVNLALNRVLITGSLLVALLALSVDWIARVVEQLARPKGL